MVSVLLSTEEDKNHTQDNLLPSPLESRTQPLSGQPGYETSLNCDSPDPTLSQENGSGDC